MADGDVDEVAKVAPEPVDLSDDQGVAELVGHAQLETTRCSLPSDADRQAAMDALTVDYRPNAGQQP